MRAKLLLALLAVPVVCAAAPRPAQAQRDGSVFVYRDRGGYRDRIFIPSHGYKDRADRGGRARAEARRRLEVYGVRDRYRDSYRYRDDRRYRDSYRNDRRYRDDYRYRNDDRYRDEYRYRDRYEYRRRRTNVLDLVLLAAAGARYNDRYGHRHSRNCGHRGITIHL